jgi:hypothetical protein
MPRSKILITSPTIEFFRENNRAYRRKKRNRQCPALRLTAKPFDLRERSKPQNVCQDIQRYEGESKADVSKTKPKSQQTRSQRPVWGCDNVCRSNQRAEGKHFVLGDDYVLRQESQPQQTLFLLSDIKLGMPKHYGKKVLRNEYIRRFCIYPTSPWTCTNCFRDRTVD